MNTPVGSFNERMLVPGILIAVAAFFIAVFFFLNQSGGKKISVKAFILYSLATILAFVLMGLTGLVRVEDPLQYFIGTQFGMLVLGIIHTVAFTYLIADDEDPRFLNELIFTIYVAVLGGFVYLTLRSRIGEQTGYNILLLTSMIAFLIPFIFYKTFVYSVAVPPREYEKWYFPIDKNFDEDLDDEDFDDKKTIIAVVDILGRTSKDNIVVNGSIRAPLRYEFGVWMATYIWERNEAKPGEKVEYLDEYGQPQAWNFYLKPKWYQSPRYIDHKLTIGENKISDKDVIICERV
jgi:hypothetical protein